MTQSCPSEYVPLALSARTELNDAWRAGDYELFLRQWIALPRENQDDYWNSNAFRSCLVAHLPRETFLLALQATSDRFCHRMLVARMLGSSDDYEDEALEEQWGVAWTWWNDLDRSISELDKLIALVRCAPELGYSSQACPGLIYLLEEHEVRWAREFPERFQEALDLIVFKVIENSDHYDQCEMFGDYYHGPTLFEYVCGAHLRCYEFHLGRYMTTERRVGASILYYLQHMKTEEPARTLADALRKYLVVGAPVVISVLVRGNDYAIVSSSPIHEICPWECQTGTEGAPGSIHRTLEEVDGVYHYWTKRQSATFA